MTEEEVIQLRKENQELRETLKQTQELLRIALARIEELEKQKTPPPAFVKANKKKPQADEKKARKKREVRHNQARPRAEPTQIIEYRVVNCPECHLRLGGISLARVGWGEFVRQLDYKSTWYGRTLIKIDRFFPSSKTCYDCKHLLNSLTLGVREWACPAYGVVHDRDITAALNILIEGLSASACGGSGRPARVRTRRATPSETGSSTRENREASAL